MFEDSASMTWESLVVGKGSVGEDGLEWKIGDWLDRVACRERIHEHIHSMKTQLLVESIMCV